MRFLTRLAPLLGLPLLLACGARSSLPEGAGGHPSTTATTTATTSSATTGPGGAPALACHLLQPILTIDDPALGDIVQPNLVALSTSPPTAALVFASRPVMAPSLAQVLSFDGWGAWPPALAGSEPIALMQGNALGISVIAATRHEDPPSSAFSLFSADGQGELSFAARVGQDTTVFEVILGGVDTPLAIASNGPLGAYVVMTTFADGPKTGLKILYGESKQGGTNLGDPGLQGCASTPITADAAGTDAGWIFGAALGTELVWIGKGAGPCALNFKVVGPATHLQFTTLPSGANHPPIMTFEAGGTVDRLRMIPRSDGAWAVWSMDGSGDVNLVRLSAAPALVAGPSVLIDTDVLPGSFDIERLGDTLVIGHVVDKSSSAPQIRVRGWDSAGPTWTVDVPIDGAVAGPIELLTSSTKNAILVAWSELAPGSASHRMRIARIDCGP